MSDDMQPVADGEDGENEETVELKVKGTSRFRPTSRHKPRKPGTTFEGSRSLLDRWPDHLELADDND